MPPTSRVAVFMALLLSPGIDRLAPVHLPGLLRGLASGVRFDVPQPQDDCAGWAGAACPQHSWSAWVWASADVSPAAAPPPQQPCFAGEPEWTGCFAASDMDLLLFGDAHGSRAPCLWSPYRAATDGSLIHINSMDRTEYFRRSLGIWPVLRFAVCGSPVPSSERMGH